VNRVPDAREESCEIAHRGGGAHEAERESTGSTRQERGTAERFEQLPLVELSGGVADDRFELEFGGGRRLRIPAGKIQTRPRIIVT
jgi:hypothetical protein